MKHKSIRQARLKAGLTQEQLADLCGWRQTRISNYENGYRAPRLQSAKTIQRVLARKGVKISLEVALGG